MLDDTAAPLLVTTEALLRAPAPRAPRPTCASTATRRALAAPALANPDPLASPGQPRLRDLHLGLDRPPEGGPGRASQRRAAVHRHRRVVSASARPTCGCCCTPTRSTSASGSSGGRSPTAGAWSSRRCGRRARPQALAALLAERARDASSTPPRACSSPSRTSCSRSPSGWPSGSSSSAARRSRPPALRPVVRAPRRRGPTLVNMYGITETTVHVTYRPLERGGLRARHEPDRGPDPRPQPLPARSERRARSPPGSPGSCSSAAPAWRAAI